MSKRQWWRPHSWLVATAMVGCLVLLSLSPIVRAVSQGYRSEESLKPGTLVSLVKDKSDTVEPARADSIDRLFGVVVPLENSLIVLGDTNSTVQVATDGEVDVLASDLAGPISEGDSLTLSQLSGIAEKVTNQPTVIGTALSSFNGEENLTAATVSVQQAGQTVTTHVGKVRVQFEISANPNLKQLQGALPGFLQAVGNNVAGRAVSPFRIILALVALLTSLIVAAAVLFSAIRSSLTAIGRNPLARHGIYRGLAQVFGLVGLVLVAGLATIYLILKV